MKTKLLFPLALMLLFTACGAPQDSGTSNNIAGRVVDGYLAGAKAYLDINGDAKHNPYEPYAYTDSDGRFGTASDNTDYCASTSTQEHCLSTGDYSGYDLRVEGGYDNLTGEAFEGVLSRTLDSTSGQVTSPASSLYSAMSASQQAAWLSSENSAAGTSLTSTSMLADPLDFSTTTNANQTHLIQTSWLVHKSVAIIAAELLRIYPRTIAANDALATDYAPYVYQALVDTWGANTSDDMLTLLGTAAQVDAIVAAARTLLEADGASADGGYVPAADMAARIAHLINLIDTNLFATTAYSQAQIYARGRAIEVLTIMLSQTSLSGNEAAAITDMATSIVNFEHAATDVSAIAADYIPDGAATTDYSGRSTLVSVLPADPTTPIAVDDGAGGTADVLIDPSAGTVNIDLLADVDGDGVDDAVAIPGTIEAINDYSSIVTLEIAGGQQTIIVETGPAGELIFDTSSLEGLDLGDLSTP